MIKQIYRVVIVANGKREEAITKQIKRGDFIIGVDRAAFWLLEHGVIPDVAVGDFDSCEPGEFEKIKKNVSNVQSFSSEKDFTDTELALDVALKKKPHEIVILGGLGSRLDHTLGTVFLLERCSRAHVAASIQDEGNVVTLLIRGRTILEKREEYTYVSVIPVTDSIILSLEGFKYPLRRHMIHRGQTIGISNEFISKQAMITIHRGKALIIQSSD